MRSSRTADDLLSADHHTPIAHLQAGKPPPEHYYATNLATVARTVLDRYDDLLEPDERRFGTRILQLPTMAQRLYARLIGRRGPLIREDSLAYAEVDNVRRALAVLEDVELVVRCPPAAPDALVRLVKRAELDAVFARDLKPLPWTSKADRAAFVLASVPPAFVRWRIKRVVPWLALNDLGHLDLYRLLFFGDRRQDLTTFVMRDLGVHRYEPVALCRKTRLFANRLMLDRYLELVASHDEVAALGPSPDIADCADRVADLLNALADAADNRMLERRRSRLLNRLGRNLERAEAYDWALRCYGLSTLAPARERRMRILHRLGDAAGVERLRHAVLADPETTLEAHFANRFARPRCRNEVPVTDVELEAAPNTGIEQHALAFLTSASGAGWHLENNLPMAIFGLAYWSWIFAPIEGAFLHPFQTGPVDLFWPDFFAAREGRCRAPFDEPLKAGLKRVAAAKAGTANRLFSWHRCPREVVDTIVDAIPEADLRALIDIVRNDLAGKRSGFPDLTVVYGPGRYEFVEVKGPNDQLQIHQRLWIQALRDRGLPVRVLRFRRARR